MGTSSNVDEKKPTGRKRKQGKAALITSPEYKEELLSSRKKAPAKRNNSAKPRALNKKQKPLDPSNSQMMPLQFLFQSMNQQFIQGLEQQMAGQIPFQLLAQNSQNTLAPQSGIQLPIESPNENINNAKVPILIFYFSHSQLYLLINVYTIYYKWIFNL